MIKKEGAMLKRKGRSIGFDAMVKFFMHKYEIPTGRDVQKIIARLDRIEKLLSAAPSPRSRRKGARRPNSNVPATEAVLNEIKRSKQGITFADIQAKTGYPDKKIRNIIFRLNKLSRIKRHSRGVYISL
jgi:Fic family protein